MASSYEDSTLLFFFFISRIIPVVKPLSCQEAIYFSLQSKDFVSNFTDHDRLCRLLAFYNEDINEIVLPTCKL